MDKLNIVEISEQQRDSLKKEFLSKAVSKGKLVKNPIMDILEDEGIKLIEETIPYIENIYRNANRLIVNEEEIVKVELAKKITIESVRHLSKHTNFIQNIAKSGDVEPAKILNIEKEESYDTYENRVIYSLIENMKVFIKGKKELLERIAIDSKNMANKKLEYFANINMDGKEISVNYNYNSNLNENGIKNKLKEVNDKIVEIESKIQALTNFDIYKMFEKKHLRPITSQLKKTNLILKNVNFQYVVKLWEFLLENLGVEKTAIETEIDLEKDTKIKQLMDEIFLLQYIAIEIEEPDKVYEQIQKVKKDLVEKALEYADLPNNELEKILADKTKKDKFRNLYVEKQVRKIFSKYFHEYTKTLKNVKG